MNDELWYVALDVASPIYDTESKNGRVRKVLVMEAGADLLAGPFETEQQAERAIQPARRQLFYASRRTWFAEYYHANVTLKPVCLRREDFELTTQRLIKSKKIPSSLAKHYDWPPPLAWEVTDFDPRRLIAERAGRDTTGKSEEKEVDAGGLTPGASGV